MSTFDRIARILVAHKGVAKEKIVPAATLFSLGLGDSLDLVDIGLELEIEFNIDLEEKPFNKFGAFTTLGELEFEIEKYTALKARSRAA